ncbi:MAG: XRE family transcriptional regulator [Desulfobacterales bacterium]|jgi:transcriptional regulator with XRE-family HTH domain|nr:XRE family transcriptional regulator [Desulfobacterales bacterium]
MQKDNNTTHINVDFFEDLTGDILKASGKGVEAIGERVKRLREEKGLTLDELSNLTGFEVEFLKRIENNEVKPQLGTIMRLSKALDSAFGRLVSGVGNKLYSITRKDEQKIISRSTSKKGQQKAYTYKSLAPEVQGRHMEALIVQLETLSEPEPSFHDGEEFIYVLDGTVSLRIGEDAFDLEPGDSAYYLSTTPHIIMAKEDSATIIAVLYQQ